MEPEKEFVVYVILYGFGTPSAFVRATAATRAEAERKLALTRSIWRSHANRFTLHRYSEVVLGATSDSWILKPDAVTRRLPEGPSIVPASGGGKKRTQPSRRSYSFLEVAE